MKLQSITIKGFKSFADPTIINIHSGITAVVGPNGCGKSNISDAIRWVLGEQRPSAVRGGKMEEVIFQGSRDRRPVNRASVVMSVSNADKVLPIAFEEVEIGRTVYRDGGSDYSINRSECRLRDVADLCRDTGLGANAYSIIENRMIDAILSTRPEDRRNLFEEAAGIGKYKDRRRSALRRLDQTDQDLIRLEDVIGEVETKVRSLARQKGKAERYKKLRERRLVVEVNVVRDEMLQVQSRLEELDSMLRGEGETAQDALSELNVAEAIYEKLKLQEVDAEREARNAEGILEKVRVKLAEWERDLAVAEERRSYGDRRLSQLENARTDHQDRKTIAVAEIDAVKETLKNQSETLLGIKDELKLERTQVSGLREEVENLGGAVQENEECELELARKLALLSGEIQSTKGQIVEFERVSMEISQELSGASNTLNEIVSQGDLFENKLVPLEDRLKEEEEGLEAIEQTLRNSKLSLESLRTEYLELISSASATKGELRALKDLEEKKEGIDEAVKTLLKKNDFGVLGLVTDFMEIPRELNVAVESYLGSFCQAVVVQSQHNVEEISRWFSNEWKGGGGLILLPCDQVPQSSEGSLLGAISTSGEGAKWAEALIGAADVRDVDDPLTYAKRVTVSPDGTVVDPSGFVRMGDLTDHKGILERKNKILELQKVMTSKEETISNLRISVEKAEEYVQESENALKIQQSRMTEIEDDLRRTNIEIQNQMTRRTTADSHHGELSRRLEGTKLAAVRAAEKIVGLQQSKGDLEVEKETLVKLRESSAVDLERFKSDWEEHRSKENKLEISVVKNEVEIQGLEVRLLDLERELREEDEKLKNLTSEEAALLDEIEAVGKLKEEGAIITEQLFEESDQARRKVTEKRAVLEEVAGRLEKVQKDVRSSREKERSISDRRHTFELERQELLGRQDMISERLQIEWDRPLNTLLQEVEPIEKATEDLAKELEEILANLTRIGLVNMLAVEEHEEQSQRLAFLSEQRDDLLNARKDLTEAIRQVNETATDLFYEAFESIKDNFSSTFNRLFEGGTVDLWLTDPTDPLESGIEIHASPKGKRTQRIELLSGGERALTALSLLFGIYLFKPSPFCVLDEVDAPLDENNIGRFIRLLDDFKGQTQFILITHNPRSIEAADWIYGVTMEEPGVSSIVGVRLEDETNSG